MPPRIDDVKCNGCGICDEHCPVDVLRMDEGSGLAFAKYPEECWHCGVCRLDCPTEAIDFVFPPQMLLI